MASGAWDAGDELMGFEDTAEIGDAARGGCGFGARARGIGEEDGADIPVLKALDAEFTAEDGGGKACVVGIERVERAGVEFAARGRGSQAVEICESQGRVLNKGEGVEMAACNGASDIEEAMEIGDAFGHGKPAEAGPAFASALAEDEELARLIDDDLTAENATGLVVQFDPVALKAVFDARAADADLEVGEDFAVEIAVEFFTKEAEDILGTQFEGGMTQKGWIQMTECGAVTEHDIQGDFGLIADPVMGHALEERSQQRIAAAGQDFEDCGQSFARHVVGETLGFDWIGYGCEGIVDLGIGDLMAVQLAREPFVTVDIDLDGKRKPGLNADMDQSEFAVHEVKAEEVAFAPSMGETRALRAGNDSESGARLDDLKDADQSGGYAVLGGQIACQGFFVHTPPLDTEWPIGAFGHGPGVCAERLRDLGRDRTKILDKPVIAIK